MSENVKLSLLAALVIAIGVLLIWSAGAFAPDRAARPTRVGSGDAEWTSSGNGDARAMAGHPTRTASGEPAVGAAVDCALVAAGYRARQGTQRASTRCPDAPPD